MPNFLDNIFVQLQRSANRVVLRELHGEQFVNITGAQLLDQVQSARASLRRYGLQPGDRCGLLGANSIRWIAIDLGLKAENLVLLTLLFRQSPAELVVVLRDCQPRLLLTGDTSLGDAVVQAWPA